MFCSLHSVSGLRTAWRGIRCLLVKVSNILLIIFPLASFLGLTQDGLKVVMKLVLFIFCPVQVLIDNPLQTSGPYPILVVVATRYLISSLFKFIGRDPDSDDTNPRG
jgi:hypothetical protein